jgi:hypothetical protein
MNGTRRDLLKYFGIGTVIVPIVSGAPDVTTPAKLIATPELKQVILADTKPIDLKTVKSVTITLECVDGSRGSIQSEFINGGGLIRQTDHLGILITFLGQSSPSSRIGALQGDGWLT